MSHHFSAPDSAFPHGDARLDLADLYAFPKPGDSGKSILIMDVHPAVGENPQGPTTTEPFAPEALYELKIDTDGDAVADIAYRVRWVQVERGARPLQLTFVFALPDADRDAYLTGEPADDARFVDGFVHTLEHKGRYPAEDARRLAGTMLPEILPYAAARPASFPGNGRTLTDDAADSFLALYTHGKVTGDKAGPHRDLLADFPYVGPPHSYVSN